MSLVDEEAITINSNTYLDTRFRRHNWQDNRDKQKALFFGQVVMDHLPDWLVIHVRFNKLSICDFGYALGKITKSFAETFPESYVMGQDISTMAINQAKKLFPELNFTHRDLLQSTQERYAQCYQGKIVKYVPNAANPDDFTKIHYDSFPDDFPSYNKDKAIGFYGALAEWVDYDLIDKIAAQFSDTQIVLIGPCRHDFPERKSLDLLLNKHRNIFYLGEKKYEELFNYARLFSISIIPFIINEVTRNCCLVKLFEYMNIGAPIVTT